MLCLLSCAPAVVLQSYRSPKKPSSEDNTASDRDDMANAINDGLAYYEQELRKVRRNGATHWA